LPAPTVAGSIAFAGGYGGDGAKDMYVVNTDGSGLTTIAEAMASEEYPVWSPDGKKIEYSRGQPGGFYDVWVMNVDGSGKTRLTHGRLGGSFGGWSPDGSRIAYSSWYFPPESYPPAHVFVMNADGSSPRQLTRGPHYDLYPSWAANGAILFLRKLKGLEGEQGDVFSVRPDGTGLTRVTKLDSVGGFAPSPDGKLLAVHDKTVGKVLLMHLAGNGATRTILDTDFRWDYMNISWSPDGKALALGHNPEFAPSLDSLYVVNVDGSGLSEIPGVSGFSPAWRPE
jgi:Tol biopolymer transport system component